MHLKHINKRKYRFASKRIFDANDCDTQQLKITNNVAYILLAVFLVSLLFRLSYTYTAGVPFADPWRHMALVQNIRKGLGFTLFDGQPYIWYSPVWYYLVALISNPENLKWVSSLVSALAVPFFSFFIFRFTNGSINAALVGGLLMAGFGPMVAFTCQLGAEAFSVLLFVCALLTGSYHHKRLNPFFSGIIYGFSVAARLQLCLAFFIFFSVIKKRTGRFFFLFGTSLPLLMHWIRNYFVINNYEYIFTWDGMATHHSEYSFFSTLAVQILPTIAKANCMLYEAILPLPQWLYSGERIRFEIILFFIVSISCIFYARKFFLTVSVVFTVGYFLLVDKTLSSHFFRNWIGLFPLLFLGCAISISRLGKISFKLQSICGAMMVVGLLACGIPELTPERMIPIEVTIPPEKMLKSDYYMVNSGFYHPANLCYRYPSKHFIGMPFSAERFEDFQINYPSYRLLIWRKSYNIQQNLLDYIQSSCNYNEILCEPNLYGVDYCLLKKKESLF